MSDKKREQELKEILKRYVNNQATPAEMEAVDRWYDVLDFEASTAQLFVGETNEPLVRERRGHRLRFWSAAAAILLLAFTSVWFFNAKNTVQGKDLLISSAKTERKQLKLSDGTEVILNTGSELVVSSDFGEKQRQVQLKGEAFFKVAKDAGRPFIIRSGQLKTRVLGTSFNISAYPERERIKVSVLTGRVQVSETRAKTDTILAESMSSNQTISFFRKTGRVELNTEDASLITSWRDNKLYIDNASLQDIAELLQGFYHLEVKDLSRAKETDRYTIRFNRESMKAVLEILTQLTKREFRYTNNKITIK
ncbi:FecR family protein [Pedobacter sp. GR22-6]|uniref:FecR family protein n=1 Tax=Pedobacter sp. GR22-6 TaxID=3127957 RepID=UPI00307E5295